MELNDEVRAEVARAIGMKPREITAVEDLGNGLVVTTHDGVRSLLTKDGVEPYAPPVEVAEAPAAVPNDPPPDPNAVPEGSEKVVLDWVGEDSERAGRALDREQAKETPRKGLVGKLQALVGG